MQCYYILTESQTKSTFVKTKNFEIKQLKLIIKNKTI